MDDQVPLPALSEGLLDPQTLSQLFADLAAHARVVEVRLKAGPRRRALAGPATLDDALQALISGEVRGVQLRYFWSDQAWIDTLIRTPGGVRITRMAAS